MQYIYNQKMRDTLKIIYDDPTFLETILMKKNLHLMKEEKKRDSSLEQY